LANMIDIIINATDNATRHVDEVNRAIERLGDNGGKVAGIMTGLTGSIAGLAPAVAGVGALASTFATAGVGAVAFGAVAVSSIGGVVEASEEIAKIEEKIAQADSAKERIKYQKELQQVMGGLSEAEKGALGSLQDFQSWWSGFTKQFDPQVFGVMSQGLDLVKNTMTALSPAITSVGNVLTGFLEKINNGFDSSQAHTFFDYINEVAGSNLEVLLTTAGNFFMGFFNILDAFAPLANDVNAGMVAMSEGFLKWTQQLKNSQSFQNFIEYARANTPPLINTIKNLWNFIVSLVQALAPLGSVILNLVSSFTSWLNSSNLVQGALDKVKQAGEFLLQNLDAVKVVVASLLTGFLAFKGIMFIVSVVSTIISVFKTLKTTFLAVRTAVLAMNTAFLANPITWIILAVVALIAIIVLLVKNWDTVKAKAIDLWNWMKTAWEGIKTAVSTAITNIITAVVNWATQMWTKITTMWENIKTAFSNGVTATVNFFKALPMNIVNALIYMIGFVIGMVVGFFVEMGLAFVAGVQAVIAFFKALPENVVRLVTAMKDKFFSIVKALWSWAVNTFRSNLDKIISFFRALPSKVMNFLNNLKTQAINNFKTMMSNAKTAVSTGISNVVSFFSSLPSKVMNFITNLKSKLVSTFKNMMSDGKNAVKTGVDNIISAIKNFGSTFLSAGKGLLESFTKGIKNGIEKAKSAVADGMKAVRDFLPFSPAKKGALSDLDKSGKSFFPTWYEGALKGVSGMERAIGGAMDRANHNLQRDHGQIGLEAFGQPRTTVRQVVEIRGTVNVEGEGAREQVGFVAQEVRESVATFKDLRQAVRKR
jgi:phage-related protein